jgi:hypothetical protein
MALSESNLQEFGPHGPKGDRMHIVVAVHGIRTFGQWQERLEKLVRHRERDIIFYSYKLGYFSFLAFLFPPIRWLVVRRFRNELRAMTRRAPRARIDLVGHSFGTHVIAWALWGLRADENISIHTIILSGGVLRAGFHWSKLIGTRVTRVVNDCGTKDNILLLSQFLVLFTGMAGRTGFAGMTSDRLRNRFSPFGHSGYFLDAKGQQSDHYMRTNWLDLLAGDNPITHIGAFPQGGALAGIVIWISNNAEPVKLSIYVSPFIALTLWILSLYATAESQRTEAVLQRNEARRQTTIALRSQSDALALVARQNLAKGDAEKALLASLGGLPTALGRPDRPVVADLVDTLDVAVSAPSPKLLFPVVAEQLAVNPMGTQMALALPSGEIQIWDILTGRQLGGIAGHSPKKAISVEFSDDGRQLVSAGTDNYISVWNTAELRKVSTFKDEAGSFVREVHFAAGSSRVFSLSNDGLVGLWDAASGKLIGQWQAHTASAANLARFLTPVIATAMSPDGEYYITGGVDGLINIWSARTSSLRKSIKTSSAIYRLKMGPTGVDKRCFRDDDLVLSGRRAAGRACEVREFASLAHGQPGRTQSRDFHQ